MATITIRNLDEKVKRALQVRAALNGRSMEAEARDVLSGLVEPEVDPGSQDEDLGTIIQRRFAALGGVDLQIPTRGQSVSSMSAPPHDSLTAFELRDGLGTAIHRLFAPLGGVELEIPTRRKSHRKTPTFQ